MSVWACKRKCDANFPNSKEARLDCKAGCEGLPNVSDAPKAERDTSRALELIHGIIGVLRPQPEPAPEPEKPKTPPMAWVGIAGGAILLIGIVAVIAKRR